MLELAYIPDGLEDIIRYYGDPDIDDNFILDKSFYETELGIFMFPFPMRLSWKPDKVVTRFMAHKKVGAVIYDALHEIKNEVGLDKIMEKGWNYFGGCFNFRAKRNNQGLSTHSWGIAIDINPHLAPYGKRSRQPEVIVEAFKRRGFVWGGDWRYKDGQHFQACCSY